MNLSSGAGSHGEDAPAYIEQARSYTSAALLLGLLLIGLLIDMAAGGAAVHLWGWLIAAVLVVGTDAFAIHTARRLRSITVTADEVRVGEHALTRSSIVGVEREVEPTMPVLGQSLHQGLPKGVTGLAVLLAEGGTVVIPTRRPDRLAAVLAVGGPSLPAEGRPAEGRPAEGRPAEGRPAEGGQGDVRPAEVRPAEVGELPGLAEIDRRAEAIFRVSGLNLPNVPFRADALHEAIAVFVAGRPAIGYVRVDEVDGVAHIEGLAVVPGMMRRAVGSNLLEAACSWAAAKGYPAVTLITFADVPWNAPFYAHRGFAVLEDVTPELAELRDWERAVGLDAVGRRVVMRRHLGR